MTSRQRGPPSGAGRAVNSAYNYGRGGSGDDREAVFGEPYGDRGYLAPRTARDQQIDSAENPMSSQYAYRPRAESNVSNSSEGRHRIQMHGDDTRARGSSVSSSPGPVYREDGRPRSGQSNHNAQSRDKQYYSGTEYQPPQFPQNPYGNVRNSSMSMESQDSAGRRSRPTSRTQFPIPPYPSTPPPGPHRFDNSSPSRRPANSNTRLPQTDQEQRTSENPYQLAPLKFSPPRPQDSSGLLAGTQFDDLLADEESLPKSPPAPSRPPPPPPMRSPHLSQSPRVNIDQPRNPQMSPLSRHFNESDVPARTSPNRDNADEEWTLESVIEFLRQNQFGDAWQQAFRDADIHGETFRSLANYAEAKKLLVIPQEAQQGRGNAGQPRSVYRLITAIRKVLNPDSDTPDSEGTTPVRPTELPRHSSDQEKRKEPEKVSQLPRSQTAPPIGVTPPSNPNLPSPDSPEFPPLPHSARLAPRHINEHGMTFPPLGRQEPPPLKLQPAPPPRAHSPQQTKRPMSPTVADNRQQSSVPPSSYLSQYRHSKNISMDSTLSDHSLRSVMNQPARSSQDFHDLLDKMERTNPHAIVPQKMSKKKSYDQMPKPGIFSRIFLSDKKNKSKDVAIDSDEQEHDMVQTPPPVPPQPPYNRSFGVNNSQSSLDSSSVSTPIDDARPASMATSVSSLPSARPPSDSPLVFVLPTSLWVQVTQDEDNFKRCDLSNLAPDPAVIRERLCQKFGLKAKDTSLYITDIDGTPDHAEELSNEALLSACSRGDSKGTLKFLVKSLASRKATASPGKLTMPSVPATLRPGMGQGMLTVPDPKDGRDVRSTSISEDPLRKGHYHKTPTEMLKAEEPTAATTDYFDSRVQETVENPDKTSPPLQTDNVNARVFEAGARAREKRERRRTASGSSVKERTTPVEDTYQYTGDLQISPTRRRPSMEDSGFVQVWGGKVLGSSQIKQPVRQASLPPASPASSGSFRVIPKDESVNVVDFENPRKSPYLNRAPTWENPKPGQSQQQLPTRTPSGIKAQRRAPAPPSFPLLPSRTATVVATQKTPPEEKSMNRGSSRNPPSFSRRSTEDDRFIQQRPQFTGQRNGRAMTSDVYHPKSNSSIGDLVTKSTLTASIIPMVAPKIITPPRSLNLEPVTVPPKRAPSPGTPGARLGITVDTNLGRHSTGDSPPTEWRTSISPYSGLSGHEASSAPKVVSQQFGNQDADTGTPEADRFKESTSISFDDAPAFDLDEDESESLWAVKPSGVDDRRPSMSRDSTDEGKVTKKSSLRKAGRNHARPPLTVHIDDTVTEIPRPPFSAIAEEHSMSLSLRTSESSLGQGERADPPEFTVGDDSIGISSPMRPSPSTPTSATSGMNGGTDITRQNSFAKHEDVWAVRPPAEVVLDNLENFFPNHDLDKPILVDHGNMSPPISPADASDSDTNATIKPKTRVKKHNPQPAPTSVPVAAFPKPTARMKSIRVVAKEAIEKRSRLQSVALGIKGANLLRRKSTKVWGARMLEMTPGQVRLGQIITPENNEDGLERRRTFKWVKGELIGKGTYGSVYLGLNATTGEMLAVKQVDVPSNLSDRDDDRSKSMVDALNAEIETLKDLDHPHIVQYLGYERTDRSFSIFLEYVPGGSVGRCLKKHGQFEENVIRSLIRQTLDGLAYLHAQGRLHRDLKADNLLLDLDGVCKISDFGISKQSKDVYANDHYSLAGTIFWMAPEVIQSRKEGYSAKIDIWSLGCVVLEMFAGKRPWSNNEAIGAMFKLGNERKAPPIPPDVMAYMSPQAKDFLDRCFTMCSLLVLVNSSEAAERPTAAVLLSHPFCTVEPTFNFSETKLGKAVRFGQKK